MKIYKLSLNLVECSLISVRLFANKYTIFVSLNDFLKMTFGKQTYERIVENIFLRNNCKTLNLASSQKGTIL